MRHVQVTVRAEMREDAVSVLEEHGVDYVVTDATGDSEYAATIFFPLPTEAVEPVVTALEDIGVNEDGYSVTLAAETVVSADFEALKDEYEASETTDEKMPAEELRTQARELLPKTGTFVLLSVVSAVVATAGLLLDSPAVVVGSMVIAPLVGPAMSTSVGSVLYEEELFHDGLRYQLLGFVLVVVGATLFAALARTLFLVPPTVDVTNIEQVAGRLTPDLLTLAVAIGSGIAGARSLSSDISTSLVGVMIAAALVPPAAAVGIGIAWWLPGVVFNAGLTVLVNALSINLAALATLQYAGYRPADRTREPLARRVTRKRLLLLVAGVLLLSAALVTFTATAYRTGSTTEAIRADVSAVLDGRAYANLTHIETSVHYADGSVGVETRPTRVVVRVGRPDGHRYPALADRIDARLAGSGYDRATVQVRFVEVDSTA